MRQRTVIIGSSVGVLSVVLGVVIAPIGDVAPLVQHISKGAPPKPDLSDKAGATARAQDSSDGVARPLPSLDTSTPPSLDVEAPIPEAMPFAGTWAQQSKAGQKVIRIEFTLSPEGRYEAIASLYPEEAATDAVPLRTIATAGVWELRGTNIVLSRMESEDASLLPMGWREVYWNSALKNGDWVYTDADGLARTLIRLSGGPSKQAIHTGGARVH